MRRAAAVAGATLLAALAAAAPAGAVPHLTPVGTFNQPVHVTAPPQDPHRLFVVEKPGRIWVIVDGGAPQMFLDITGEVDEDNEEGLLSLAFAADYATSERFYVYFTATDAAQGGGSTIRIVEFTRLEATPNSAVGAARRTLLSLAHPDADNHNGGQLAIGPDGLLWLATGDGAVSPPDAQDNGKLQGKLLRIDPTPSATGPYSIPPDNPFAGSLTERQEIWASGLRNPWRFSFDRSTGDLALGDVGAQTREEIDFAPSGTGAAANYGWPCREGTVAGPNPCAAPGAVDPVFDYDSSPASTDCGVMGGLVVRDPALPTLAGRYLYADLCGTKLRSLVLDTPNATDPREEDLALASTVSFGEDSCGHVYVASIAGTVARIDDLAFTPCPEEPDGGDPGGGDPGGGDPGGGSAGGGTPDGGAPGPSGPPAGNPPDLPPGLGLDRARRQRLFERGFMHVGALCTEDCILTVEANVRLTIRGKLRKWRFAASSRPVAAGQRVRLRLRVTKAMRAALAERVARGAKPLVKVVVTARDAAGNETLRTVYARVIG